MTYSMTGFGRCELSQDNWAVKVEIKAVNHRYLDTNIRLPRSFNSLEEPIRQLIKENIGRGRIEIYASIEDLAVKDRMVKIDKAILQGLVAEWHQLQEEIDLPDLSFDAIIQIPDLIQVTEAEVDLESLMEVVSEAVLLGLQDLNQMRLTEGSKLSADISNKLNLIEQLVNDIVAYAPKVVFEYRDKLNERLLELIEGTSLTPERFEAEVAIFADRSSIDEEIVRLQSHTHQFHQSLATGGPIGRKLDFLIQEMNREVNTIGSKANNLEITKLVVEIKSELERIREQVQNLE